GQAHQLTVVRPAGWDAAAMIRAFEADYARVYGRIPPGVGVQALQWRLTARGPAPSAPGATALPLGAASRGQGAQRPKGGQGRVRASDGGGGPRVLGSPRPRVSPPTRPAYFGDALTPTSVFRRESLPIGQASRPGP